MSKGQIPLHYPVADQVADLDADLRVRVAGRSDAGRKPATNRSATRFELSWHVEIADPVCDLLSTQKSRKLVADPHELVESQVGNQVCDLDSVTEFGL